MPFWRATSISSVPFSASISLAVDGQLYQFRHDLYHHLLPRQIHFSKSSANFSTMEIVGMRRRVAQRAEGPAQHVFRQLAQQRDVFAPAAAFVEALQDLSSATSCLRGRECTSRSFRARRTA